MERIIDKTIVKFGFYGFFKNLRFFEPFIYLYFLSIGLGFFEIGLLFSIREISMYLFEIPTGVIADIWGRKRCILLCFFLYVISFFVYYLSHTFLLLAIASLIFGLGEAFRLGTHKAIIFDYLDSRNISQHKAQVYGFTRGVALIGSSLSAIIAAILLIWNRDYHAIFLFSIIPYLMAFLLVLTYPVTDKKKERRDLKKAFIIHAKESLTSLVKVKDLKMTILNSGVFDGVFKSTFDYIQPVIRGFILTSPLLFIMDDAHIQETLLISLFYFVINILGALSSNFSYCLNHIFPSLHRPLNYLFLCQAILLLFTGLFIQRNLFILFLLFLLLFITNNLRRPLLLSYLVDQMGDWERATMLSVESQVKSLAVIILAPLLGRIVDVFSIQVMFLTVSLFLFSLYILFLRFGSRREESSYPLTR